MSINLELRRVTRIVVPTMIKVSDEKTNVDPNGMLLNKQSQGIFNINTEDMIRLINDLGSEGAANRYVEMITQRPLVRTVTSEDRNGIITSEVEPSDSYETQKSGKVVYFNNSWENWSWDKIIGMVRKGRYDESPAVYWTKYQHKDDPFSIAYDYLRTELRNRKLVNKNRQVIIINMSVAEVVDDAISFIRNTPGLKHIWIQGHIQENGIRYGPYEIAMKIINTMKKADVNYTINQLTHQRVYTRYWKGMDLLPISLKYNEIIKPQPCVPFRVDEYNFLEDRHQTCAQMYPCTALGVMLNARNKELFDACINDMIKLMATTPFMNYSEHVMVMLIDDELITKTYDFLYKKDPNNDWVYIVCGNSDPAQKYVVTDEFMMGSASIITSRHRSYGLCRDVNSLIRQQSYKGRISGHMIAAQLAYTPHLLWYLYEVYYNYSTKKSTYKLTVIEPTEDRYHNREEYENAIREVHEAYYKAKSSPQSKMLFGVNIKISKLIISLLV